MRVCERSASKEDIRLSGVGEQEAVLARMVTAIYAPTSQPHLVMRHERVRGGAVLRLFREATSQRRL